MIQGNSICIPKDYSKFDLPNETRTVVNVGIDIKDIPKIDDKDFSVPLNAFFVVQWTDERLLIDQEQVPPKIIRKKVFFYSDKSLLFVYPDQKSEYEVCHQSAKKGKAAAHEKMVATKTGLI